MRKDRRLRARVRTRLKVEFGIDELEHSGFTADVSAGGIFLVASRLFKAGTCLHLHIRSRDQHLYFEGKVVRVKRVPETLRRLQQQGMGIKFLKPDELVPVLVPRAKAISKPSVERGGRRALGVDCASPQDLVKLINEQLRQSICAVSCPGPPPSAGAVVEFEIRLGFLPEEPVQGTGRVAQVLELGLDEQGNPRRSVVLEVNDSLKLSDSLEAALHMAMESS
jgi:hypothetical protein